MGEAIRYRGPDGADCWTDPDASIGLAHRRLAIVDLSPAGRQPMHSADGRLVLSYNGEIYNHAAIRAELDAAGLAPEGGWRGHSDTETLLAAISVWGLQATLERAYGMFAIALWDRRERQLTLVRDRFGEKPLYYGWAGGDFVFASELGAIRCHPGFSPEVDRRGVRGLLTRNYIPAPLSIYQGIFKLTPGTIMRVDERALGAAPLDPPEDGRTPGVQCESYFDWLDEVRAGEQSPIRNRDEALAALDSAMLEVTREQAEADVPVGAFLSGGFDSSTICAYYQRVSSRPIRTYTIGFDDLAYNEAEHAKAVAEHLGTEHHELYVHAQDALDIVPRLPQLYTEPFADISQIPTYIVSRLARQDVTVVLSGDGGDELFSGYTRHWEASRNWHWLNRLPRPIRRSAGAALGWLPGAGVDLAARTAGLSAAQLDKIARLARRADNVDHLYGSYLDPWWGQPLPLRDRAANDSAGLPEGILSESARFAGFDAISYLPDDILVKVDRASMAVSLESRVPFLDARVARVAARIDPSLKIRDGGGKWILKQLLYTMVPEALVDRPKRGFGLPIASWLRGPLRDWAEALLDPRRLAEEGLFDPAAVASLWQAHLKERGDHTVALWSILMLQAWLDEDQAAVAGLAAAQ